MADSKSTAIILTSVINITENDLKILAHLRKNARTKVTDIARDVNIPVTTLYSRIRAHAESGVIQKHATIIDFSKLGYPVHSLVLFESSPGNKQRLKEHLHQNPHVNTLYRTDFDQHFFAECVFEHPEALQDFVNQTDAEFGSQNKIFHILSKPKNEEFSAKQPGGE